MPRLIKGKLDFDSVQPWVFKAPLLIQPPGFLKPWRGGAATVLALMESSRAINLTVCLEMR
jgi:hypothetical protein